MNLRRLSNEEFTEVQQRVGSLDVCPTCGSRPEWSTAEHYGREPGTYRYRGKDHVCKCDEQIALRKHYAAANLPAQYLRLDWADYDRSTEVTRQIAVYLRAWKVMKADGRGLLFGSHRLGTGKTWAATAVARDLIKRGEKVYFIQFIEVIALYDKPEDERWRLEALLKQTPVLILDEVTAATTVAQGALFNQKLEEVIRHRTHWNLPTIITTNLSEDQLHEHYPRSYSLLSAKQTRIEMPGGDHRLQTASKEDLEIEANHEVRPLV